MSQEDKPEDSGHHLENSEDEELPKDIITNAPNADLSGVVHGTAESLINKLEENLNSAFSPGDRTTDQDLLLQASSPGPLDKDGINVEDVLNIISQSIYREGEGQVLLKLCDRSSLLSVVSHSLSAYITTLDPVPLQRLSSRIANEVSLWVCQLFKFAEGAAYCHDDTREGLVKVTRMALHKHYPKMAHDGFEALFSRPPVIYLTSNTYLEIAYYVCLQLGLPRSAVRVLKFDAKKEDVNTVEEIILEDKAAGRLPIMCVANVHSAIFQGLNPVSVEALCRKHDVWLHLEGHALAGLALLDATTQNVPTGDSLSLTIGSWLGVPALPFVTLYKTAGLESPATTSGLNTVTPSVRLNCLPLWCVLRSLGEEQFNNRVANIFQMMEILNTKMAELTSLRILSQRPEQQGFVTVDELSKPGFDVTCAYKTVSPALAFQYVSNNPPDPNLRVPAYFNNLNSWLGQTMQRDCPQIPLEIVDVETTGYVLRLCPFESLAFSGNTLTDDDLEAFIVGVETQTSILSATVDQRQKFINLIDNEPKLEHVEIPHWAGLGGVCYLPEQLRKVEEQPEAKEGSKKVFKIRNFSQEDVKLINQRNAELVAQLRNIDSAFSLGESGNSDGRVCIRFGMVSADTDVEELLSLVVRTGSELDEQLTQLETMSSLVLKGIEQAQEDLRRESDDALWQEGILRHVPIVGSFYNWISPIQKPQVKGRYLSLKEGKVDTTESIYKEQLKRLHDKGDANVSVDEEEHNLKNSIANETSSTTTTAAEETAETIIANE